MHTDRRRRQGMISFLSMVTLGIGMLLLQACTHSQETHAPDALLPPTDSLAPVVVDLRALVVGRHPAAVAQASEDLQRLGFTLVQRDPLQQILNDQDIHLSNQPAAQAYLLHSGFVSGAEVVVFVDVDGPRHAPSVIVKGLDVETSNVLWSSGIVSTQDTPPDEYHRVVIDLTHRAVMDGFTKPQGGSTAVLFSHP